MRVFVLLLGLLVLLPHTAQANMRSLLVCQDLSVMTKSLDKITDDRQTLDKDESILVPGCWYSTLAQYSYNEYPDWWYHVDRNGLFFDVNRIKLVVNGHFVEWYTMSLVSRIEEFEDRPSFIMSRCTQVPGRLGCWTNRARVFSLDPQWSELDG